VSGTFGTVKGALLADRQYVLSYTATSVLVTVEPLPPTVTAVSPSVGPVSGGTKVTISGTNFVSGATVNFGAAAASAVTVVSAKKLTATAPARAAGSVDVTVTTGGGTSRTSAKDLYAYGAPMISSFTPSSGITGSGCRLR
jgi:hypothetical protein